MKEVFVMAILIATIVATQEEIDLSKYHAEGSISSCELTSINGKMKIIILFPLEQVLLKNLQQYLIIILRMIFLKL